MMRRLLLFSLLLGGLCIARGQTGKVRYWYDEDVANLKVTGMMNGSFEIDGVDQLSVGLHKVTTLLSVEKDTTTSVMTCLFYIPDRSIESYTELYYWFDDDTANRQNAPTSGLITVSAESLSEGLHSIHFAAVGAHPSSVMSYLFYVNNPKTQENYTLRFWADENVVKTIDYVVLDKDKFELDVNFLTVGEHQLYSMLLDADGNPMSILVEGMEIPDQASRINSVDADQKNAIYYSLEGKRVQAPQKGLNIIRSADGNLKKVVVR